MPESKPRESVSRRDLIGMSGALMLQPITTLLPGEQRANSAPVGATIQAPGSPMISVPTVAALRGLSIPSTATAAFVLGYHAPLDMGGGVYGWDPASRAVDNGGTVIRPSGNPAQGRWRLKSAGSVHVAQFGALSSASASTNRAAIQAAMNHVLDEGGELVFEPRAVYQLNDVLDFRNTDQNKRNYPRSIRGHGATLDFSGSRLRGAISLVSVGGVDATKASETAWSTIDGLLIKGPENNADMEPRHSGNGRDATANPANKGMTGLSVQHAVKVNLRNVEVSHCYRGIRYYWSWGGMYENVQVHKCIIGHHVDAGCTHVTFVKPQATSCTFPYLVRPDVLSAAIGVVTFITPHLEDCTLGFILDQNATRGVEIDHVHVIDPYIEDIYGDAFRVGMSFDPEPGAWATPGAARQGLIGAVVVDGGRFAGEGAGTTKYNARRKAFRFSETPNVSAVRIAFPCGRTDIVNLPGRAILHSPDA
jgi:hypothetical protein